MRYMKVGYFGYKQCNRRKLAFRSRESFELGVGRVDVGQKELILK